MFCVLARNRVNTTKHVINKEKKEEEKHLKKKSFSTWPAPWLIHCSKIIYYVIKNFFIHMNGQPPPSSLPGFARSANNCRFCPGLPQSISSIVSLMIAYHTCLAPFYLATEMRIIKKFLCVTLVIQCPYSFVWCLRTSGRNLGTLRSLVIPKIHCWIIRAYIYCYYTTSALNKILPL